MDQKASSLFINKNQDEAIVNCSCGNTCRCGQLHFSKSDDPEDEFFIHSELSWFPSGYGFLSRLKLAWRILVGHSVHIGHYWNKPTCIDLFEWLTGEPKHDRKSHKQIVNEGVNRVLSDIASRHRS